MKIDRRRFLTALGLTAGSLYLPSLGRTPLGISKTAAQAGRTPTRILFFVTQHGLVPPAWHMRDRAMLGRDHEFALGPVTEEEFSPIFRPLHRHRDKLLLLDNLSMSTSIAETARVRMGMGHDGNEHHLCQAHLMTGTWSVQRSGATAIGGGISIDNHIGNVVRQPGRPSALVYGWRHQHSYSFTGANEPSAREGDPARAFADLMGYLPEASPAMPSPGPMEPSRDELLAAARGSALDLAAGEFERISRRLGREDRLKLEQHMASIRNLELSFRPADGMMGGSGAPLTSCDPSVDLSGSDEQRFARLAALAFACDVTRVLTVVARPLSNDDFGAPSSLHIHQDIAHNSTPGEGEPTEMRDWMSRYNTAQAEQFVRFLDELDAVPEGDGTLLDHTCVVWLTELSTGTHWRDRMPRVIAGGAGGYFNTGRYVYYQNRDLSPFSWGGDTLIGPGESHLRVSLMRAMGLPDEHFGLEEITSSDGSPLSLRGVLPRLTS